MTTIERWVSAAELVRRQERCRDAVATLVPEAGGLLVFSRLNIFYLAGTYAAGVLWLPLEGAPVLLSRRGVERARLESHLERLEASRSFRDLPGLFADCGSPLTAARTNLVSPWLRYAMFPHHVNYHVEHHLCKEYPHKYGTNNKTAGRNRGGSFTRKCFWKTGR